MLVLLNYALNYASKIYQSLARTVQLVPSLSDISTRKNAVFRWPKLSDFYGGHMFELHILKNQKQWKKIRVIHLIRPQVAQAH